MRLPIEITTTDGRKRTLHTSPWSTIVWERKYNTKIMTAMETGLGIEDLAYLAYAQAKLNGWDVPDSFEAFAQDLVEISAGGDESAPFDGAASAG